MSTGLTLRHEGQAASLAGDVAPHRQFARYIEDRTTIGPGPQNRITRVP